MTMKTNRSKHNDTEIKKNMEADMNTGVLAEVYGKSDTVIETIDPDHIDESVLLKAGHILRAGGLVAFPTETVYGLGADALNEKAAEKTYAAKGRPSDNPLIVHIADMDALERIVTTIPKKAFLVAEHFWPGPLTMIFHKADVVPYGTTGGLDTVAVRMPVDEVARALIRVGGGYVSGPSANSSGRPSPTRAEHVAEDLTGKIDMILDAGDAKIGVESTILDMTVEPPMILRPGAITQEMLEEIIGVVVVDEAIASEESTKAPKAPGMKYRHYAPKASLTIIEGPLDDIVKAVNKLALGGIKEGKKVGIIATEETRDSYGCGAVKCIGSRANEETIAQNLYGILRDFDQEDVDYIYSESFAVAGIGDAIMNRLGKAAGHQVIRARDVLYRNRYSRIMFVSRSDTLYGPVAVKLLEQMYLEGDYHIDSRGVVVLFPEPINQKMQEVLRERGLLGEGHNSQPLEESDFGEKTLILILERDMKDRLMSEFDRVKNIYPLVDYAGEEGELPDLCGHPLEDYRKAVELLEGLIEKLAKRLNEEDLS